MSSLAVWSAIVLVWGGREKLITDIKGKERKITLSLVGLVMENKGTKSPVMCWLIFQKWWNKVVFFFFSATLATFPVWTQEQECGGVQRSLQSFMLSCRTKGLTTQPVQHRSVPSLQMKLQCRVSSVHTYCPSPSLLCTSLKNSPFIFFNMSHEKRNPPISFLSDWLWWGVASLTLWLHFSCNRFVSDNVVFGFHRKMWNLTVFVFLSPSGLCL